MLYQKLRENDRQLVQTDVCLTALKKNHWNTRGPKAI